MKTTQAFLREFNDAFATNDQDFILDSLTPDVEWNMVGGALMKGKEEVRKELQQMDGTKMLDMEVLHIICDDQFAAVDGRMRMRDQAEIDHYWDRLSEGGDVGAQQCGWLKDKFGVSWQIVPEGMEEFLNSEDPARARKGFEAMLGMKKIDLQTFKNIV